MVPPGPPDTPKSPRVPDVISNIALVVQLVLAIAVGAVVVDGLVSPPTSTAPWALGYLGWCIVILRRLADRSEG